MLRESDKTHRPAGCRHSPGPWRRAAVIAAAVFAAAPGLAAAATYYVDAAAGSDGAAGTSPTAAWQTLAKVNATTFSPGDSILLHTGQRWAGQLHPLGSGAAAAPIVVSSYGGGARPIIDGSSLASGAAVYLYNQGGWTIDSLEVVNDSGVPNVGTISAGPLGAGTGINRSGIFVDNESAGVLSGITIQNNYVHDVNGCFACSGDDPHANGGIIVVDDASNVAFSDALAVGNESYNNVRILNNTVSHVGREGIVFWDNSAGLSYVVLAPAALSSNVTIQGNGVYNVDGDGITISGAQNSLIDHNTVGAAGLVTVANSTQSSSGGIWAMKTIGVTMQYNEVYGVLSAAGVDGQAFDNDFYSNNTIVQYNYSHDNQGGFMLMEGQPIVGGTNLTVRYNLSVNDAYSGVKGVFTSEYGTVGTVNIYNNTIYIAAGLPSKPILCDGCLPYFINANVWNFDNNIVANFGSGNYTNPAGPYVAFSNNLFFGNHPAGEPADAHKVIANPLFVAPAATAPYGLGSVAGYQVGSGSPAIGAGAVISGNGGRDYFGRSVSATAAPTLGFYEAVNY
ncbi:MAG TPA: right-handed parallel beta-helix repeat-containing protein [Nevskia sp.]|nr:right-handed parallel beta-helix repeat-containing protein [Nevskia sp.]